jgi:hypothetical protein
MFCMARGGRIVVVGISFETLETGPMVVLAVQRIGIEHLTSKTDSPVRLLVQPQA